MGQGKVIDCAVTPPFKEFFINPSYMDNYARVYGIDPEKELKALLDMGWTVDSFTQMLDGEGIDIAVIRARDIETTYGLKITNEACANIVKKRPDRFIGLAGVDPLKGEAAVEELDHAVRDLGLRGVDFWTYEYKIPSHDRRFYPIYEKCLDLKVPVFIESSMHFSRHAPMDICRPIYLDYIAIDFPDLLIVGSTPGWPWVSELMGVAWRHPNVYVSTSTVRPKYFSRPNSGYETLLQHGNSTLQDKIMFASGWPMLSMKQGVEEIRALPLKDAVKEKWLYHNAAQLFRIDGGKQS